MIKGPLQQWDGIWGFVEWKLIVFEWEWFFLCCYIHPSIWISIFIWPFMCFKIFLKLEVLKLKNWTFVDLGFTSLHGERNLSAKRIVGVCVCECFNLGICQLQFGIWSLLSPVKILVNLWIWGFLGETCLLRRLERRLRLNGATRPLVGQRAPNNLVTFFVISYHLYFVFVFSYHLQSAFCICICISTFRGISSFDTRPLVGHRAPNNLVTFFVISIFCICIFLPPAFCICISTFWGISICTPRPLFGHFFQRFCVWSQRLGNQWSSVVQIHLKPVFVFDLILVFVFD